MSMYIPPFLYVSLGAWIFYLLVFLAYYAYLRKVPDDKILEYEPKTIKQKRELNIKIFKF